MVGLHVLSSGDSKYSRSWLYVTASFLLTIAVLTESKSGRDLIVVAFAFDETIVNNEITNIGRTIPNEERYLCVEDCMSA